MGIGARGRFRIGQAYAAEQVDGKPECLAPGQRQMCSRHLGDLLADSKHRIEARRRILKDEADVASV